MNITEIQRLKRTVQDQTKPADIRRSAAQRLLSLEATATPVTTVTTESRSQEELDFERRVNELKAMFDQVLAEQAAEEKAATAAAAARGISPRPPSKPTTEIQAVPPASTLVKVPAEPVEIEPVASARLSPQELDKLFAHRLAQLNQGQSTQ